MYCTECGTKIIDGAKFCIECGAPVKTILAEAAKAYEEKMAEAASVSDSKAAEVFDAAESKAAEAFDAAESKAAEAFDDAESKAADAFAKAESDAADQFIKADDAAADQVDEAKALAEDAAAKADEVADKADEVIAQIDEAAAKEEKITKDKAEELAKLYEADDEAAKADDAMAQAADDASADSSANASESPKTAHYTSEKLFTGEDVRESFKSAGEEAKKAAQFVTTGVGSAVDSLQLTTTQLITMILSGASFLFLLISIGGNGWLIRLLVIGAAALLTFFVAKRHELPKQTLALPFTIVTLSLIGQRIINVLIMLLRRYRLTITADALIFRLCLAASLVLLLMITFNTQNAKKAVTGIFTAFSSFMAVYHLYSFIRYIRYSSRTVIMYALGLVMFFAAYALLGFTYLKKQPSEALSAENRTITNTINVTSDKSSAYNYTGTRASAQYGSAPLFSENKEDTASKSYVPKSEPQVNTWQGTASANTSGQAEETELADKSFKAMPQADTHNFCTRCGSKLGPDALFCSKCGYPVNNSIHYSKSS